MKDPTISAAKKLGLARATGIEFEQFDDTWPKIRVPVMERKKSRISITGALADRLRIAAATAEVDVNELVTQMLDRIERDQLGVAKSGRELVKPIKASITR